MELKDIFAAYGLVCVYIVIPGVVLGVAWHFIIG
jgi:hypothetical protein